MKKCYSKLLMLPIVAEPEEGILGASIQMKQSVTVEPYKDGFADSVGEGFENGSYTINF